MKQLDLIDKFDQLEIDPLQMLAAEDLEFCKKVAEDYTFFLRREELLTDALESMGKHDRDNHFRKMFSDAEDMLYEIQRNINDAYESFASVIIDFFNNKYHLGLDSSEAPKTVSFPELIKWIISLSGGSLTDIANINIIEDFRRSIGIEKRWAQSGTKVCFEYFDLRDFRRYGTKVLTSRKDKNVRTLLNALNLFANKAFGEHSEFHSKWPAAGEVNNFPVPGKIEFNHGGVKEIRYYLNNRLDIVFDSCEVATGFVKEFQLQNNS